MENCENLEFQLDEINALKAIYGDEFVVENEQSGVYSIKIRSSLDESLELSLEIRLPKNYPSDSPPIFEINCPYLSADNKSSLALCLQEIYLENLNQPVIYMWIEALRTRLDSFVHPHDQQASSADAVAMDLNESQTYSSNYSNEISDDQFETDHRIKISSGSPLTDRKSTFQAHLASPIGRKEDVEYVLNELRRNQKIARATHNMYAYRIFVDDEHRRVVHDCEDDGEKQAGGRLAHLLEMMDAKNVLVVVSRWYGGIHLGGDRFKHINNVARELLEKCGYASSSKNATSTKHEGTMHSFKKSSKR